MTNRNCVINLVASLMTHSGIVATFTVTHVAVMNRRRLLATVPAAITGATILPQVISGSLASISSSQAPLPYTFDALEPFLNASLLKQHFIEHHQPHAAALDSPLMPPQGILESIASRLNWMHRRLLNLRTATQHGGGARTLAARLCTIRDLLREHGGGHVNHSLFWRWMAPPGSSSGMPVGAFATALETTFGSLVEFRSCFTRVALSVEGDGWAWLVLRADRSLAIMTTSGEDNPLMRSVIPDDQLGIPILGIDMAPHAFAAQYSDNRQGYIKAWWQVVNWPQVAADYDAFDEHSHLLHPPAHDPLWGGVQHDQAVRAPQHKTFKGLLRPAPPSTLTQAEALHQSRLRQAQAQRLAEGSGSDTRPTI